MRFDKQTSVGDFFWSWVVDVVTTKCMRFRFIHNILVWDGHRYNISLSAFTFPFNKKSMLSEIPAIKLFLNNCFQWWIINKWSFTNLNTCSSAKLLSQLPMWQPALTNIRLFSSLNLKSFETMAWKWMVSLSLELICSFDAELLQFKNIDKIINQGGGKYYTLTSSIKNYIHQTIMCSPFWRCDILTFYSHTFIVFLVSSKNRLQLLLTVLGLLR